MKRIYSLPLLLILLFLVDFAAIGQNLTISGGSGHSVMICGRGRVYAWGANYTSKPMGETGPNNVGLLGLSNPADQTTIAVTTPLEVDLPVGLTFNQVDAGSGSATIGLACNGVVYAWGSNTNDEVGQGPGADWAYSIPVPVVQGATPAVAGFAGQLADVFKVAGSTNASFAIMNDGRLVSWGSNVDGQLGNPAAGAGTSPSPVYVQTTGGDLQDVIDVDAGDSQGYALVDPDGDGIGSVYSWGRIASFADALGRPTANNGIALPVLKEDNSVLDSIVQISAGDQAGFAVDVNGNVWGWGEHGWGCQTGTKVPGDPFSSGAATNRANKVVTGEQGDPSGYLTGVTKVTGGRATIYALLDDNTLVAWGDNSTSANGGCATSSYDAGGGGTLGNGVDAATLNRSCEPVYVRYNATTIVDDAIDISDGDTWAFLINQAGDYYAWGTNHSGVLGIGSCGGASEVYYYPQEMTPNIPCELPDACPATYVPNQINICPGESYDISAGFTPLATSDASDYTYTWYTGTSSVGPWTVISGETGDVLQVQDSGYYRIVISYTGSNTGCGCEDSEGISHVSFLLPEFGAPSDSLFFCNGSTVSAYVETTDLTSEYAWFATDVSTDTLEKTFGTGTASFDISTVVLEADGSLRLWVEDNTTYTGVVFEQSESCDPTFATAEEFLNGGTQNPNLQTRFVAFSDATLTSVDLVYITEIYNEGNTLTGDLNFAVYGSQTTSGGDEVADQTNIIQTFTYSFSQTRNVGDPQKVIHPITVPLNIPITGSAIGTAFFISPTTTPLTNKTTVPGQNADAKLGIANCTQDVSNIVDDLTGEVIHMTGLSQNFSNNQTGGNLKGGHFYNLNFEKGSDYVCGRVPIDLFEKCPPCTNPSTLVVDYNSSAVVDGGTIDICEGTALSVDLSATWPIPDAGSVDKNFEFYVLDPSNTEIYSTSPVIDGDGITSGTDTWTVPGATVLPALAGTYTIGIRNTTGCTLEQTVDVNVIPPTAITTDPIADELCVGEDFSLSVVATGDNLSYQWIRGSTNVGTDAATYAVTGAATTDAGSYTVEVTGTCGPETSAAAVVTVNENPSITVDNPAEAACFGTDVDITDNFTEGTGATITYHSATPTNGGNAITNQAAINASGTYYIKGVSGTGDMCSDEGSVEVTINPLPTAVVSGGGAICDDATATSTITITFTGTPNYAFTYDGDNSAPVPVTGHTSNTYTFTTMSDETFTVTAVQDGNACDATSMTGSASVTYLADVAGGATVTCDASTGTDDDFVITVQLTAGDFSSDVVTGDNGVTFTDLGAGLWEATGINELLIIDVVASDGNSCNSFALDNNNRVCSCPEVATISGDASICEEGTPTSTDLTVAFTGGGAAQVYNFEIFNSTTSTVVQTVTAHNGDSDYILAVNGPGVYQVRNVTGSCAGSGVGSAAVIYHPSPAAVISGGGTICDNTTATTDVFINFTNTATPYSFTFNGSTTGAITETGQMGSQYTLNTDVDEFFDWSGTSVVTDANGCTAKAADLTGDATIDYFNDPDTTSVTLTCDPANPVLPPGQFNYFITVEVTPGSGTPSVLSGEAATFTNTSGNTWVSDMIDENILSSFTLSDENDCNPVTVTDLNLICSCPETATLSATLDDICEEGTPNSTDLQIVFTGGTTYDFDIERVGDGVIQSETGYNGSTDYSLTVNDAGTYRIVNFQGACPGNAGADYVIDNFPSPAAVISGTTDICDNATATTDIRIDISNASAPYSFTFNDPSGAVNVGPTSDDPYLHSTNLDGVYDWTGGVLTDNNGCTAKLTDLTGSATVGYFSDPSMVVQGYSCPNGQNPDHNYIVTIEVTPGSGTPNPISPDATFTNVGGNIWESSEISELTTTSITLTDENNCNPVMETGVNFICSCPTTASISATNTEICNDGTSTVTLDVVTAGGTGPYDFTITGSSSGDVDSPTGVTSFPYTLDVNTDETFTLSAFTDQGEGCQAGTSGSVEVTVNPLPTATISGGSDICDGQQAEDILIDFTGTAPFTVGYTGNPGGTGVVEGTNQLEITNPGAGTYEPTALTDDNGCVATPAELSGSVTVISSTRPTATISGGGEICAGDTPPVVTIDFDGTGTYDVTYTDGNGNPTNLAGITSDPYTLTDVSNTAGTYNYTISALDDGCESISTDLTGNAPVQVNGLPSVSVVNSDSEVCDDGLDNVTISVTITPGESGSAPFDVIYSEGSLPNRDILGQPATFDLTTMEAGSHEIVSVEDANGCVSGVSNSIPITLHIPKVLTIASNADSICVSNTSGITLTITNTDISSIEGLIRWYQDGDSILGAHAELINRGSVLHSGTYTATIDDGICPETSTMSNAVDIQIDSEPIVSIDGDNAITFEDEDMTINGTVINAADGLEWIGSPDLNGLISTNDTVTFAPMDGGIYTYILTATNGQCTNSSNEYIVTVIQPVKIPNAFTPNGDTDNEVWDIRGMSTYNEAVIKIFNRWGNLVYEKFGTYTQWDGTHMNKGKDLPVGTYYYVIDLGIEIPGGGSRERRGHVSIIR